MNQELLLNKVIVVAGGTKGVGRGTVMRCASLGAKVIFSGRDPDAATAILQESRGLQLDVSFVPADLTQRDDCEAVVDYAYHKFGRVDGLLHYAGITTPASLLEATEEEFDAIFSINLRSAFFCAQAAVKKMLASGGGSIIFVGSPHSQKGDLDRAAYACSKGALLTLNAHIAQHYAPHQIRCNIVTMGWTPTEGELAMRMSEGVSRESLMKAAAEQIPMGRMQSVEDHLAIITLLLSDESSAITGSDVKVCGGLSI